MIYALNLDSETNRILSATYDEYGAEGQPRVEALPTGETEQEKNINNWLYKDGEYVYDPLPEPEPIEPTESTDDVLNALLGMEVTDNE